MRPRFTCLALTVLLFAPACGLTPPIRALKGSIQDDRYTAPGGIFSVAVPMQDDYERTWMQAKEVERTDEFYISFGPAAFDQSIYRLSVILREMRPMQPADLVRVSFELSRAAEKQLQAVTGAPLELKEERATTLTGDRAYYMRFRQLAPAGTVSNKATVLRHESLVVLRGSRMFTAWKQSDDSQPGLSDPDAMTLRQFAASVVLAPR